MMCSVSRELIKQQDMNTDVSRGSIAVRTKSKINKILISRVIKHKISH